MADGDVKQRFLADTQSAEAAITRLERKLDALENKQKQVARTSRQGNREVLTGMQAVTAGAGRVAASVGSMLAGYLALPAAIASVVSANREFVRQAGEAQRSYDTMFRQFRVQAGLTKLQGGGAQSSILAVAQRNAVTEEVATAGAKGLVGAGFSVEASTGSALNALLRGRAATNATGGTADDLEGLATSIAAYLTSQGLEKTTENLDAVLQSGFALRQTGAFELGDLTELGKQGAVFAGKLSMAEQFAAFGTLVDAIPAAESSTAMRNIVSRMSTASVGRTSGKALDKIGLQATDIDLVGEDFMTALGRIQGGLQTIPEEERDSVLKQLFEEAGVAPAKILMQGRGGRFDEYLGQIQNVGPAYGTTVDTAQSGIEAAQTRLQLQARQALATSGNTPGVFRDALDAVIAEQIASGEMAPIGGAITRGAYSTMTALGVSPETAMGMLSDDGAEARRRALAAGGVEGLPGPPSSMISVFSDAPRPIGRDRLLDAGLITPTSTPAEIEEAMRKAQQAQLDELKKQTAIMQGGGGQPGQQRQSPPINRNANTEN